MAKRKNTSLTKSNQPVEPGFNFNNRMKALQREEYLRKKKAPSIPRSKAGRVG